MFVSPIDRMTAPETASKYPVITSSVSRTSTERKLKQSCIVAPAKALSSNEEYFHGVIEISIYTVTENEFREKVRICSLFT